VERACDLTPPSSGHATAGFACRVMPLMSNVRRHVMNALRTALAVALTVASGLACDSSARYEDVSAKEPYASLVGRTCEARVPLRAHGVTAIGSPHKRTDYITVWEPGFTGPEVTFVEQLPVGTSLRVVAARSCSNCPFDELIDFIVHVEPRPSRFESLPVYVQAGTLRPQYVDCAAARRSHP